MWSTVIHFWLFDFYICPTALGPNPPSVLTSAPLPPQQPSQQHPQAEFAPQLAYGPPPPAYGPPYWVQPHMQGQQASVQQWGPVQNRNRGGGRGRGWGGAARSQYNGNEPPTCWTCGQKGHMTRNCPQRRGEGEPVGANPPVNSNSKSPLPRGQRQDDCIFPFVNTPQENPKKCAWLRQLFITCHECILKTGLLGHCSN